MGVEQMGVYVVETTGAELRPYRIWKADAYVCPGCDANVISAFGQEPYAESYKDGFAFVLSVLRERPEEVYYWHER